MPTSELYSRMERFEKLLDSNEGSAIGYLVLSITGNNRKEWIWYVADKDRYMARVNDALSNETDPFPVEFEPAYDPDWKSYTILLDAGHAAVH